MDVVVKNIQAISGKLDIDSEEGVGSQMTLTIPLTLAIIEGIVMKVGESTFVIETSSINKFIRVTQEDMVKEPDGDEYVMIRGTCYPVIRLSEKYDIPGAAQNVEDGIMMLVENDNRKLCVFADHLIGQQEIVVKPLPSYIKKIEGLSGCTQLGDGSIAIIIDIDGLT